MKVNEDPVNHYHIRKHRPRIKFDIVSDVANKSPYGDVRRVVRLSR